MTPAISVLVCTYKRSERLLLLLGDLAAQTLAPSEVVVVDNDAAGSARAVVEGFSASAPFPVRYDVQPRKNISITRNRTVELATGEWLAFIDDDERAPPDWLQQLYSAVTAHGVSGVQGPVLYPVPEQSAAWLRNGDHYGMPRDPTGTEVLPNRAWINNALIRATALDEIEGPFDEAFGITGGEDGDMICRLMARGHRLVWCDEAVVSELVAESRLNLKWILLRAMRGGQDYTTHWKRGLFGPVRWYDGPRFVLQSAAKCLLSAVLAVLMLPRGRHHSVRWLRSMMANFGKLSALFGMRYREYAAAPVRSPGTGS